MNLVSFGMWQSGGNNSSPITESADMIQTLIDIIDTTDDRQKADRHIKKLKDEYGYVYQRKSAPIPSLDTILPPDYFGNFQEYRDYASDILKLRQKSIDYNQFYRNLPGNIGREELTHLLNKHGIKHDFSSSGVYAHSGSDWVSFTNSSTFDVFHVLHELSHLFQNDVSPITYSLTEYGLINSNESFADNNVLYTLNPPYFMKLLPSVGYQLGKSQPRWYKDIASEILNR